MAESQNVEYKESWRDEYLKWVCGFAKAYGGTISAIAKELSLSNRAIEKSIKDLKDKGIFVRNGTTRSGYWEIVVEIGEK